MRRLWCLLVGHAWEEDSTGVWVPGVSHYGVLGDQVVAARIGGTGVAVHVARRCSRCGSAA